MAERIIVRVRESCTGQKTVTIPVGSDISRDDYVEINKIDK